MKKKPDAPHVAALRRAVAIVGNQVKFANGIAKFMKRPKFKQQTVSSWLRNGTHIAAEFWPAIEHLTKGAVGRQHLRPDVFGKKAA